MNYRKSFVLTRITDILKEFQEGIDFTVESKEKIIFHNEKLANCLMRKWGMESFFEAAKSLIPSPAFFSYEEKGRSAAFTFKSKKTKKDSDQEIPINWEAEKKLEDQKNKGISEEELFGLEKKNQPQEKENLVKKDSNSNINYNNWTKNQLISEINKLKTEIESLKTNPTLTSSEKQTKIQQNQQQLEKLTSYYNTDSKLNTNPNNSNSLSTNLAIGGGLLAIVGLISFLVIRKHRKNGSSIKKWYEQK